MGRIVLFLEQSHGLQMQGVDVSEPLIALAKHDYPELADRIQAAPAEKLPFADGSLNGVICWGVFDLTDQGAALAEMIRVLDVGGRLLVTGKNHNYHTDDTEALAAERGVREKRMPNHFTDYSLLIEAARTMGCEPLLQHLFIRRGDFMLGKRVAVGAGDAPPERFYEYALILQKHRHEPAKILPLANPVSRTWREVHDR